MKLENLQPKLRMDIGYVEEKSERGWYHWGICEKYPMGLDEPVGPFATFDLAFANFVRNARSHYADSYQRSEACKEVAED
jgi:hypothetical protein